MPATDVPDKPSLTRIQALYFELIRTIRYNELDGGRMVDQLLEWRGLWDSVLADRLPVHRLERAAGDRYDVYPPLSLLRTTRYDDWPADTLYIWTDRERLPRLQRLIEEHWQASEIELIDQEDVAFMFHAFCRSDHRVLMVWWD